MVGERDLVGWRLEYGWSEICRVLSGCGSQTNLSPEESVGSEVAQRDLPSPDSADLRFLTLHIHGSLSRFAADLLHVDAAWIKQGLCKLTSLRRLEIVVEDEETGDEVLRVFEGGVRELAWGWGSRRRRLEVVVKGHAGSGGGEVTEMSAGH